MDKQYEQKSLMLIIFIAIIVFFLGMGEIPFVDPEETTYVATAREMLREGSLLSPVLFDKFILDKPPLYLWFLSFSQSVFGTGEFASRFLSGLMALFTSLLLYFSITKLFNEQAGFWSSLVLTTSIGFICIGKIAVADSTLVFFMTGALLCFLHKQYFLMYICMALGTLTKGLLGIVFPMAIICLYLLSIGNLGQLGRMHLFSGSFLYLLVTAPWCFASYQAHGMAFIDNFLVFPDFTLYATPACAAPESFWYYFPVLLVGLFPWTGMVCQSVFQSVTISRIDDMRVLNFMHIWWVLILAYFSLCPLKTVSYILPLYPALAIIVGWNISRLLYKQRHNTTYYGWGLSSLALFGVMGIVVFFEGQPYPELGLGAYVLGGILAFLGIAIAVFLISYKDIQIAGCLHALTGMIVMTMLFYFMLPLVATHFSMKSVAEYYNEEIDPGIPLYVEKALRPGMMLYGNRHGVELLPQASAFAEAVHNGEHKNFIMRGTSFRNLQKAKQMPETINVLKEQGDIYILELRAAAGK